jgi:hypothetical protein
MNRWGWLLALVLAAGGAARAQWEVENSGTTADLRGIDNVGGGAAWASGTNGTVLRTEDGGYLWQACAIPPGAEHLDFRGIQAFDANTAIVLSSGKGDLSRLYKTTDGCQTWKLVFTNPDPEGFWDEVEFYDHSQMNFNGHDFGFVLGDPVAGRFVLFFTLDGGDKWSRVLTDDLDAANAKAGAFAASNSAMTLGYDGLPMFGTSGPGGPWLYVPDSTCTSLESAAVCLEHGLRFEKIKLPLAGSSPSAGIFSLAVDPTEAVAVGGDYGKPDSEAGIAATSTPWMLQPDVAAAQTPPHGYRSAVAYDADAKVWITVGPNGTDISTDDGKNWRALHPDPAMHESPDADRNWNALSLPFVVGPHGRIGKLNSHALAQH